jgi:pseudaminic acid synthase
MKTVEIDGRKIGSEFSPYIIAELSGNHNQSIDRAKALIKSAKECGADAVKLQTYTAETMTLDVDHPRFVVKVENQWDGEHLFKLYQQASTPWEWHQELFDYAKEQGITIFSSPFDPTAVEFLESLGAPAYKIASFELVDHNLIALCAATGKPLIMSTGMATLNEISEAVEVAKQNGAEDIIMLKCTSAYPAAPELVNLRTIPHMESTFDVLAGLSDHTMGVGVPVAAVALGATVIEKHFTLARSDGGVDSAFSLEPEELKLLVEESMRAHAALGQISYAQGDVESSFKKYRRSLFVVRDLKAGDVIGKDDVKSLRPGDGLAPKYMEVIVGKTISQDAKRGTPVTWDLLA